MGRWRGEKRLHLIADAAFERKFMCHTPLPLGHLPLARGGVEEWVIALFEFLDADVAELNG